MAKKKIASAPAATAKSAEPAGPLKWVDEHLHSNWRQRMLTDNIVYKGKTKFQSITILDNKHFGRVLMLDNIYQTSTKDEFVYHEMLTHVPIFSHGAVKKVLIIGGGDGGILREVLRHPEIEKAVMVEIDGEVISLCREHMPSLSAGAFDHPRAELIVGDGAAYVNDTTEKFDVIIVDSTDPMGPGEVLFGEPFYRNCARILTPHGIVVTQNGVAFLQGHEIHSSAKFFRKLFTHGGCYVAAIPLYVGGVMALGYASPGTKMGPLKPAARKKAAEFSTGTKYYNPDIHDASFALPNYVQKLLAD